MPTTWRQFFHDLLVHYRYRLESDYQFNPRTRRDCDTAVQHKLKSGASHLFAANEISYVSDGEIRIDIRAGFGFQRPTLPALEEIVPSHLETKWKTERKKMSDPAANEVSISISEAQSLTLSDADSNLVVRGPR